MRVALAGFTEVVRAGLTTLLASHNIEVADDGEVLLAEEEVPEHSEHPVVLLARTPRAGWQEQALSGNLRGLLTPAASGAQIAAALHAAAEGLLAIDPSLLQASSEPGTGELTARELQVLRLLAEGSGNKTIAWKLGISEHTAKYHVASILQKLGAGTRTEAVTIGVRRGLVPL